MTGESNVAYDALLLVSFGGPEGHEDVMPFLRNVTRGRAVSEQRLAEVAEHYHRFDGVSPINAQCRALLAAIRAEFATHALDLPVYWGNRNWPPTLDQAMATMAEDGIRRALVLTTAAYPSYPGCRQYREDLARARCEVGDRAPRLDKLRHYFNHPGFLDPMTEHTLAALDTLPVPVRDDAELVFSTHSIPTATARTAGQDGGAYVAAHVDVARTVAAGVRAATGRDRRWALAYQSRSGPPDQSWLEPDINEHLRTLGATGVPAAVVVPIGFVSDHMEVRYDLDVEARATAEQAGIGFARAATVGTAAAFVAAIRELVVERMATAAARDGRVHRAAVGALGPSHDVCPPGCCPNPRGALPAAAGGE